MIYHIAICEDNITDLNYISTLVSQWAKATDNNVHIETFPSSEAFLFYYTVDKSYDILLLDIEMGSINGVQLAKQIRKDNDEIQIIFITGYPDFIAEGYEVFALQYMMKPVVQSKLFSTLDKAVKNLGKVEHSVVFSNNGEVYRILESDIMSIEVFAHSCIVRTTKNTYEVKSSISELEKALGESFIRCHRSYIVGIKYIKSISKTDVILDNGIKLPLSRSNRNLVNQAFIRYFKGECYD